MTTLPNIWHASAGTLVVLAAGGLVVGTVLAWQRLLKETLIAETIIFAFGAFTELQSAWRLRRALRRFAAPLPPGGIPFTTPHGVQGLRWPAYRIEVRGRTTSGILTPLRATYGDRAFLFKPRHAAAAGEQVAANLQP